MDISKDEQVACLFRYADDDLKIQERFVGFYKTASTTGQALAELIEGVIKELGLSITQYLVGQGYDGAANMSGHRSGLSAIIRSKVPRAIYVHCVCHCLNLVLQDASSSTEVRNCLGKH